MTSPTVPQLLIVAIPGTLVVLVGVAAWRHRK